MNVWCSVTFNDDALSDADALAGVAMPVEASDSGFAPEDPWVLLEACLDVASPKFSIVYTLKMGKEKDSENINI